MRIRSGLVGGVHVHRAGGGVVVLRAGDTVPDGAVVAERVCR